MACTVLKGRDNIVVIQENNNAAYGVAPTTPNPLKLKFSQLTLDDKPTRQQDPTITDKVLMEKTDEVDQSPDGSGTSIADLNGTAYVLLRGLFGPPVTTGSAAPYTHVFTMTNACKPDFLIEGNATVPASGVTTIERYLGLMFKSMSWDVLAEDQNFAYNFLMARLVQPTPATPWDTTPNVYPKQRAVGSAGSVSDTPVAANSTLGKFTAATIEIDIGLDARRLADGQTGYGIVLPGQITFKGKLDRLYEPGGLDTIARANGGTPLYFKSASKDGSCSITIAIPNAEFSLPATEVKDAQSIVRSYDWMAYNNDASGPVTVTLVNGIPNITT